MKKIATKSVATSSTSATPAPAVTPLAFTSNAPTISEADIQTFVNAIDAFAQVLGAEFAVPQPEDVKRMPKARKEAPTIVSMVADLSGRYGVASAAYPAQATLAQQEVVNTLTPVAERIAAVQKLVGSVLSVGQSNAWNGSMVTYGLLKSEARGNAVLRNALAQVREKLRGTYETADGGKTKVRSRSKTVTSAKSANGKGTAAAAVTAPEPVAEAAPVVESAATPAPPAATDATKSS